ncbi:hypothetical protein [Aeromicrobium piscarium]|uniref:hypothetical protein n=1 Tax=Aeromicrobium piscarium TaxID=2590901 RepID=UPI001C8F6014|nr:hypothetical protein [Aeromicrobium piscarium]
MTESSLTLILTVLFAWPTVDTGIDVRPDPGAPGVVIGGERITPGRPPHPGAPSGPVVGPGGAPEARPPTTRERIQDEIQRRCPPSSLIGFLCSPPPPDTAGPEDPPQGSTPEPPSPEEIERAIREIDLPPLSVAVEPRDTTLVNLPTNLYTTAPEVDQTVDILGVAVRIRATPVSFTWRHGDGTQQTTSHPGAPYPNLAVTHRYTRAAASIDVRLDAGYQVDYAVDDGSWTRLDGLIVASGPPTTVTVRAAEPVLVRP